MRLAWIAVYASVGCSPTRVGTTETGQPAAVFPARYEDDSRSGGPVRSSESADGGASSREPLDVAAPPDPQPLEMAEQWEYAVHFRRGHLSVDGVEPRIFETPRVTARRVGRFAIELWIGRELVERVRFDFPLLAAEPAPSGPRRPLHEPPSFAAGADSVVRVLVPQSPRATRAVLVDRATGKRIPLPWPPDDPISPPGAPARSGAADASSDHTKAPKAGRVPQRPRSAPPAD